MKTQRKKKLRKKRLNKGKLFYYSQGLFWKESVSLRLDQVVLAAEEQVQERKLLIGRFLPLREHQQLLPNKNLILQDLGSLLKVRFKSVYCFFIIHLVAPKGQNYQGVHKSVHVLKLTKVRESTGGLMYINLQLLGGPRTPWTPQIGRPCVKKCQIWHYFVFLFHKLTNLTNQ